MGGVVGVVGNLERTEAIDTGGAGGDRIKLVTIATEPRYVAVTV